MSITLEEIDHIALPGGHRQSDEEKERHLQRIERLEPSLHSSITLSQELTMESAAGADGLHREWRSSRRDETPSLSELPGDIRLGLPTPAELPDAGASALIFYDL